VVTMAEDADVRLISDIDLLAQAQRKANYLGITGTNGKSTTTALVGHLLRAMGERAQVGGNIGRPVLDLDPEDGIAVVEVSSFQIDLSPTLTPDVGALLNISADHLDRHGTLGNYVAIKERLVAASRIAVFGEVDGETREVARRYRSAGRPALGFAVAGPGDAAAAGAGRGTPDAPDVEAGIVATRVLERRRFEAAPHVREVQTGWRLAERRGCGATRDLGLVGDVAALRGEHNLANVAAALAIVAALGLDPAAAAPHLATFPGLPHRMEEVGRAGEVLFINDSKATNVDSAITALKAFRHVHWIAGGRAKPGGLAGLDPARFDIRTAYLIGEAADGFADALAGTVEVRRCGTLDAALAAAATDAAARGGGVVLLSPACASFDQFRSFEHRGDTFRDLVRARLGGADG